MARRFDDAVVCIREASSRLKDAANKDFLDLLILKGDLSAIQGEKSDAREYYSQAIRLVGDGDKQRSEIAAGALLKRGQLTKCEPDIREAASLEFCILCGGLQGLE